MVKEKREQYKMEKEQAHEKMRSQSREGVKPVTTLDLNSNQLQVHGGNKQVHTASSKYLDTSKF